MCHVRCREPSRALEQKFGTQWAPDKIMSELERLGDVGSIVIGWNSLSLQFAEICHAFFGSPVECRYLMRRMHRSSGFQTVSLST
jgi:hypothetical protein